MKQTTSQQLANSLAQNNARVRYEYERYPEFIIESDVRVIVGGPYGSLIDPENVKLVGRDLVKLRVLQDVGAPIFENGGRVTASIIGQDGEVVATGVSECSVNDVFDKELGRRIALGRALKAQERGLTFLGPKNPESLKTSEQAVSL